MSDVGLFPAGALAWFWSLGLVVFAGIVFAALSFLLWFRHRRTRAGWRGDRVFGYALGALAIAIGGTISVILINWSGALGRFSHWLDQPWAITVWILCLIALGPAIAAISNRN